MNNTLCLGIFCALVYFRDLKWYYSAGSCRGGRVSLERITSLKLDSKQRKSLTARKDYPICTEISTQAGGVLL